ncbi:DUF3365 domain-containing protein [Myxococcota bacterium]|nr:DUF3365 domain-containing protein [Myxococcota bacterium]
MKTTKTLSILRSLTVGAAIALGAASTACGSKPATGGIEPKVMTDALYAVMSSDRAVYTKEVVNRLANQEKVIKASEHFTDEKALPLPAQMFRMGAEASQKANGSFSYSLLSLWPINKQNSPKTAIEKQGLEQVAKTGESFYAEEELGGKKYFTAVYPDKGVSDACVSCHNEHVDSPRSDFKLNEIMGGVVIRVPLGV